MTSAAPPPANPEGTAPHPTLAGYYTSPEERQAVVDGMFDDAAQHYDWICKVMAAGTGSWYRREVLVKAGLRPGMRLLDVATGTGLVAREAVAVLGDEKAVVGLDPSAGMLRECRKVLPRGLVRGVGEALPFPDSRFDMVSMGYALRHVPDLERTFREYLRVLKPGGRVVVMEIVRPQSKAWLFVLRLLMKYLLPVVTRIGTRSARAQKLMRYYWETIVHCVPPEAIQETLRKAGFAGVHRRTTGPMLSEYVATRP
jgi:demethylmenaquinone methyltransferase/2-methoxy-6-polyprenyl-1,4-benzoquinol methylase